MNDSKIILPDSVTQAEKQDAQDMRLRICQSLIATACPVNDVLLRATAITAYITGATDKSQEAALAEPKKYSLDTLGIALVKEAIPEASNMSTEYRPSRIDRHDPLGKRQAILISFDKD